MKKFTLLFISLLFLMIATGDQIIAQGFTGNLTFTAKLDGAQETPSVPTGAYGVASFVLNPTHDTMCIKTTVVGLSGPITLAHIHEGVSGVSGPPIVTLTSFVSGNDITASIFGSSLTHDMIAKFIMGEYYINIHTSANPNGEIRGQIGLETDHLFTATFTGDQETPVVPTSAFGLGVLSLSHDKTKLKITAKVSGLSGTITLAHLHLGAPGVSGAPVETLTSFVSGNSITAEVDPAAYLDDLLNGDIYFNIHTAANPNGEIRGQVLIANGTINFDMSLDGSQETPSTGVAGTGVGYTKINAHMDTLWYDIVSEGLTSSPPTLAHFHVGPAGVSGTPIIDVTSDISGDRISGRVTGASIPADFLNDCLTGDVYFNIHTTAHPGGEIRGQLKRYAREGSTYTLDGSQETPVVTTSATGSGFSSIDRDRENVHFMFAFNDLSGNATLAHFHEGAFGVSGNPIFTLTSLLTPGTSDSIFGYWKNDDTPDFDTTTANKFLSNQVYMNVHTAANPNGEIRGQSEVGGSCFLTITGIKAPHPEFTELSIYPNPSADNFSVEFNNKSSKNGRVVISNIQGKGISDTKERLISGKNKFNYHLDNLNSGIYLLQIYADNAPVYFGKIVRQ